MRRFNKDTKSRLVPDAVSADGIMLTFDYNREVFYEERRSKYPVFCCSIREGEDEAGQIYAEFIDKASQKRIVVKETERQIAEKFAAFLANLSFICMSREWYIGPDPERWVLLTGKILSETDDEVKIRCGSGFAFTVSEKDIQTFWSKAKS